MARSRFLTRAQRSAPLRFSDCCRRASLGALVFAPLLAQSADSIDLGRRLYREGLGVDGRPVTAIVQGDVPVTGSQLACAGCHKRSGLGASEGGARASAVTAPALFEPATTKPASLLQMRPPYDDRSFKTAVESGRTSDGRELDALMPRYRLTDADMSALTAYQRVLGSEATPGIGETEIELATIVSADAPARDREAVATVVQRFAAIRNGGTRNEQRRAAASRRHLYGERHARAFRSWNVSVWTLDGAPSSWPEQLEALYARRPPFAVISGAAGDNWSVVADFCERKELPCLLPVTGLPGPATGSFFNLYFSAGVRLDARVTASSVGQGFDEANGNVVVVHVDDARGRTARDSFVASWPVSRQASLVLRSLAPGDGLSTRYWQDLLVRERPATLVAWVSLEQLQTLASAVAVVSTPPSRIYTADSFTDWTATEASSFFEGRVLHVYPYNLPTPGLAQFPREQAWLRSQGLGDLETRAAAEALFACHAVGEAMLGMADNYSREYLVETLEHMLDGTSMTSLFPVTTLGSGQRHLVKGAFVTRLAPQGRDARYESGSWIQP